MSLINQVLNELEKRGENAPLGETTIRAIPPRKRRNLLPYAAAAVVLVVLAAVAKWHAGSEETASVGPVAAPNDAKYELVSGLSDASSPGASMTEAASAAMPQIDPPASKLSFELASIPLPGSLRTQPASAQNESPDAVAEPIRKTPAQRQTARSEPVAKTPVSAGANTGSSPLKQISPRQHAENEFNKAIRAEQQGMANEAIAGYEGVLRLDPLHHAARRALTGALLGVGRNADAERVLQEGLKRDSHESSFAMLLARLQVERDDIPLALGTLEKTLPYADQQPEYHAFVAALLQRQNRHKEAITHFQIALQLVPGNGIWWMGAGISMQAVQRNDDARDAFQHALGSNNLSAQLQEFVQKKLKELGN